MLGAFDSLTVRFLLRFATVNTQNGTIFLSCLKGSVLTQLFWKAEAPSRSNGLFGPTKRYGLGKLHDFNIGSCQHVAIGKKNMLLLRCSPFERPPPKIRHEINFLYRSILIRLLSLQEQRWCNTPEILLQALHELRQTVEKFRSLLCMGEGCLITN
jgi:hypothetical protein